MKRCTNCGSDNSDDAVRCRECGGDSFEAGTPSEYSFEPFNEEHADQAWVTLMKCVSLAEADAVAMLLRSENIPVQIPDEFSAQSFGTPTTVGFVRVQVPPALYLQARETLETESDGSE